MTHVILTPDAARTALGATIRHQLREAWERGMETAPHGVNALADRGAPVAFEAIMRDVEDYVTAITSQWREKEYPPTTTTDTEPGGSDPVIGLVEPGELLAVVADDSLTVCQSSQSFVFAPGHRMRAAKCLICHLLIGSGEAALVGVGVLAGDACRCGGVVSDLYLIHACHVPLDADDLATAVHRGLACQTCNPTD